MSDSQQVVYPLAKRLTDIIFAILGFIPLLILVVTLWCYHQLTDGQPALYAQTRIGHRGPFVIYKLRTMDARRQPNGPSSTVHGDKRITRIGRWFRRSGLDELPQIMNILRGEMSLVGPRPLAPDHDRHCRDAHPQWQLRYRFKPGITGLSEVRMPFRLHAAMNAVDYRVLTLASDLEYASTYSWLQDVMIILRTPRELWRGHDVQAA